MTILVDAERKYPPAAHRRTHRPPAPAAYASYRPCLRLEFSFTCVYCLSAETEVALLEKNGTFEIEHFRPKAKFRHLRNAYGNLLWACQACNRAKRDTWPKPREQKQGMRFVDPTKEPLDAYLRIVGEDVVPANGDPAGAYMIDELNLNSALHKRRRRQRAELLKCIATLEAAGTVLRERVEASGDAEALGALSNYKKQLKELVALQGPNSPWDAPSQCACA